LSGTEVVLESDLPALDRAAAFRERGALHLYEGHAAQARTVLEVAWQTVSSLGQAGEPFLAPTAQLLGYTYAVLGREAPAVHYLNLALKVAVGVKRVHPLHSRAQVHLQRGRYEQAFSDLQEASTHLPNLQSAAAHQAYLEGLLACGQGQWTVADALLSQASEHAQTSGETGTEFLAELGLASVLTVQGEYDAALPHLLRAQHLKSNVWEKALFELRSGSWAAAQGQAAQAQLEAARDAFTTLDLPREIGWAELHLAACALPERPAEALAALRRAVNHRHRLGNGVPLLPELRLLPNLVEFMSMHLQEPPIKTLLNDRRQIGISEPLHLRLRTFGRPQLLADGEDVPLPLKRTLELLAFLLLRGPVSRDDIVLNLWPDDDPRKAVTYFHQVNHQLKSAAPALRLTFDKATSTYTLRCEGPVLTSDIGEMKRLLRADDENLHVRALELYTGPFLPQVDAQWAREEGDAVEWSMINTALELMARWTREGRYDKCQSLARRLVEVFPCDESLVEYLVEATLYLDGPVAAQRTLVEAGARAELSLNHTPDWVARLQARIHQLN